MILDPNKTYLEWNGNRFPNSMVGFFQAPAGSTIDWGDGTSERFDTNGRATHDYADGKIEHTIVISGLTSINDNAFLDCSGLMSVTIGNSVTSIGNNAFGACSGLTSITIPNSVTSIGNGAFAYCTSLTNVAIPDYVTSIGGAAFTSCSKLTTMVLFPETPPTLGSTNAIPTTTTIYVQQSSKEAYKTATNWTSFEDKIESNDIYLSLIRFNKKNKEYIAQQIQLLQEYIDGRLNNG